MLEAGGVAQRKERLPSKRKVVGSNPTAPANFLLHQMKFCYTSYFLKNTPLLSCHKQKLFVLGVGYPSHLFSFWIVDANHRTDISPVWAGKLDGVTHPLNISSIVSGAKNPSLLKDRTICGAFIPDMIFSRASFADRFELKALFRKRTSSRFLAMP